MLPLTRLPLAALAVATLAPTWLLAQVDDSASVVLQREAGFGIVRDKDRNGWEGATVVLEHRAHPAVRDEACIDRIEVTADARGQFRAALLPGARYSVWARGELETDGTYRQTNLVADATSHTPIVLMEQERGFVRRLRVAPADGDATWDGVERRYMVGEDFGGFDRFVEIMPEDGVLTLPVTPDPRLAIGVWVEGFSTRRLFVPTVVEPARKELATGIPGPGEAASDDEVAAALREVLTLTLEPLHRRDIALRDADGAPVAGARFWPDSRAPTPEPAPVTGDDGVVHAFVASENDKPRLSGSYVLWAPGCQEWALEAGSYNPAEDPVTERILRPGVDVGGRLLLGGEPVSGATMILQSSIRTSESSTWFGVDGRVVPLAKDGTFTVPGRVRDLPWRLVAVLPPDVRARLSGNGIPAAPLVVVRGEHASFAETLGDIDLAGLSTLDVTMRNPDGTPPGSVPVLLKGMDARQRDMPHEPTKVYTDHRGRVRLLADSTAGLLLLSHSDRGSCLHRLEGPERTLDLRLDGRTALTLRVRRDDGSPAAGYVVIVNTREFEGLDPELARAISDLHSVGAFRGYFGTTDADGRATVVVPFYADSFSASVSRGDEGVNETVVLELDGHPAGEPFEVRLGQ